MNARTITSAVVAGLMVVLLTACGTTRSYPDNRPYPGEPRPQGYPYPDGRYPDGRYPDGRYPDGRSYPTSRYPNTKRLPPGQAKKIYGGKSAKVYAPGHNKDWDRNKEYKRKKAKKYKRN